MCTILDIRAEGRTLKQFAHDQVARTVTHFEERKADQNEISSLCRQIMGQLDKAIHTEELKKGKLDRFQKLGLSLYDQLFTQHIKEKLQQTKDQHLILKTISLSCLNWKRLRESRTSLTLLR